MNTLYTLSTPADFSIFAHAFAVDPVDMMSSMRITIFGSCIPDLRAKACSLFFRRFTFVSFDCLRVQWARIGFILATPVLRESHDVRRSIWLNPRIIYRLQCIGTLTRAISSWDSSQYCSTIFINRSTYSSTCWRSDRYL